MPTNLRTPLSAIALCTRLVEHQLEQHDSASSNVREKFKTIRRNVWQLQEMISAVLDENAVVDADGDLQLAHRQFDVWPLVESLVEDLRPTAAQRTTKLLNAIPEDLTMYADAAVMRRMLQNLVANAVAFTAAGEVEISATARDDGSVVFVVRDTGAGISPERISKIFDKHETQAESPGGLGLGLAMVRTMMEAHGGAVTVESALGSGSTFRLLFPGPPIATATASTQP